MANGRRPRPEPSRPPAGSSSDQVGRSPGSVRPPGSPVAALRRPGRCSGTAADGTPGRPRPGARSGRRPPGRPAPTGRTLAAGVGRRAAADVPPRPPGRPGLVGHRGHRGPPTVGRVRAHAPRIPTPPSGSGPREHRPSGTVIAGVRPDSVGGGRQRGPPRRGGGSDRRDLQSGQDLLPRAGGHQVRSGLLLPGGGRRPGRHRLRPAGHAPALPRGGRGQVLLPEAGPDRRAGVAADHRGDHAQRHHVQRPGRRRRRPRAVGGQPGLPRPPPVALPGRRPRPRRRAPHRPRPPARDLLRRDPGGRRLRAGPARRAGHRRLPEDHRQPGPPRLRPARAAVGQLRGPRRRRWPWPASSSAGTPT